MRAGNQVDLQPVVCVSIISASSVASFPPGFAGKSGAKATRLGQESAGVGKVAYRFARCHDSLPRETRSIFHRYTTCTVPQYAQSFHPEPSLNAYTSPTSTMPHPTKPLLYPRTSSPITIPLPYSPPHDPSPHACHLLPLETHSSPPHTDHTFLTAFAASFFCSVELCY